MVNYHLHKVMRQSTSGEDFIKHVSKSVDLKTLSANFSKNNLDKDVDSLEILSPNPLLLYVHDMNHPLARRVVREIFENREISCFIVRQ